MNPEDRARQVIDRQLGQCGWAVQDKGPMNISAALGVAVREFPMLTGEVDYLLYPGGKAIGVLEAKPKGHPLIGFESQASRYSGALPSGQVRCHTADRMPKANFGYFGLRKSFSFPDTYSVPLQDHTNTLVQEIVLRVTVIIGLETPIPRRPAIIKVSRKRGWQGWEDQ